MKPGVLLIIFVDSWVPDSISLRSAENATTGSWQVGGNVGPSRTGISWSERGGASD